jgi:hypothetical protein
MIGWTSERDGKQDRRKEGRNKGTKRIMEIKKEIIFPTIFDEACGNL